MTPVRKKSKTDRKVIAVISEGMVQEYYYLDVLQKMGIEDTIRHNIRDDWKGHKHKIVEIPEKVAIESYKKYEKFLEKEEKKRARTKQRRKTKRTSQTD